MYKRQNYGGPGSIATQPGRFQITSSVFAFQKATNQWTELGTGPVVMFSGASGTVRLTNAPGTTVALDHTIMPGTKLEPNIGSDRAWVFRARSEASGAGDVLALQFSDPMSAERFANTFDDLLNGRESALAATAPPAPQAAAAPAAMAARAPVIT